MWPKNLHSSFFSRAAAFMENRLMTKVSLAHASMGTAGGARLHQTGTGANRQALQLSL
jgi:hypothetical protein